jgi:hypothetical protein
VFSSTILLAVILYLGQLLRTLPMVSLFSLKIGYFLVRIVCCNYGCFNGNVIESSRAKETVAFI